MAERRKFIASLSHGGEGSDVGQHVHKARQDFIASLTEAPPSSAGSGTLVEFDLASLLEFKGAQATSSSYKQPPATARLRPNYDSSKRKLYANPEVRQKYLNLYLSRLCV